MPVNLYQLDSIEDRQQAIAFLDEFIAELIAEFIASAEGKDYGRRHPNIQHIGIWIDCLVRYGYIHESVTLSQMKIERIERIVTQIFPQQNYLFESSTIATAIPELVAFWQFLQQEYQLPRAPQIIEFLRRIEPEFDRVMNDSDRCETADCREVSPNIIDLVGDLGIKGSKILSHDETISLEHSLRELAIELLTAFPEEVPTAKEFHQQLEQTVIPMLSPVNAKLSTAETARLEQPLTATNPGTVLQDFETLLDFIGESGISVGTKRHFISMKPLAQLNQKLAEPVKIDLQRPQQKSYPTINGLYLLLRASGMGRVLHQGKKAMLMLDESMLAQWQQMNLTERYFNLLDAWLAIADAEILGERECMTEGARCLQYWSNLSAAGQEFQDYKQQQEIVYYPGFHNLALMKLFGLVEANYGQPERGKGWRVENVRPTEWGQALIKAAFPEWTGPTMLWDEDRIEVEFGTLQSVLQPYFPQWQRKFVLPRIESRSGVYVFKVRWHQIWRRIAISSDLTFWDLSQLILQSVNFDSDHLDMFVYKNRMGKTSRVVHPYLEESPATDETKIADLPLEVGSTLEYLFDFGDNWEFELEVESIDPDLRPNYGEIIAGKGKAPQQYPDWEEY